MDKLREVDWRGMVKTATQKVGAGRLSRRLHAVLLLLGGVLWARARACVSCGWHVTSGKCVFQQCQHSRLGSRAAHGPAVPLLGAGARPPPPCSACSQHQPSLVFWPVAALQANASWWGLSCTP